jgi:hypothetical protein
MVAQRVDRLDADEIRMLQDMRGRCDGAIVDISSVAAILDRVGTKIGASSAHARP